MSNRNIIEPYLREKRDELIWAMSDSTTQGYSMGQISRVFNIPKPTVQVIIERKPDDWKVKWVKK